MKLTQATAAAILALTATSGVSASILDYQPSDAAAVQRCISQSCGRIQAPDTQECWERCQDVVREKERWEKMRMRRQRGRGGRKILSEQTRMNLKEGSRGEGERLRYKHELEIDDVELRHKHGLEQHNVGMRYKHELELERQEERLRHKHALELDDREQVIVKKAEPSTASANAISSYAQVILDQHNKHRANHSAPALTWSNDLAHTAQQIGETCVYAHNTEAGGGGYGQNIAAGPAPALVDALLTNVMYYGEVGLFPSPYGQAQPNMSRFHDWAHFTQMVWNSTTSVGCATVDCSASGLANTVPSVAPWFTVCNYSPPGNVDGEYGRNVAKPEGHPAAVVGGPKFVVVPEITVPMQKRREGGDYGAFGVLPGTTTAETAAEAFRAVDNME